MAVGNGGTDGVEVEGTRLLTMTDVVKDFPGVRALDGIDDGIDLDVIAGEVHCLLGQNGAGKSTLIKVLSGVHRPDDGRITWQGEEVTIPHPTVAMKLGIATIHRSVGTTDRADQHASSDMVPGRSRRPPRYSQCQCSGLLPSICAQSGWCQPKRGALVCSQRMGSPSHPPVTTSTARPQPWLLRPGVAASVGLSALSSACAS
jgi:energy-coupling factor transporter ATP-binding protein EcfA2